MKTTTVIQRVVFAVALGLLALGSGSAVRAQGCGLAPLKPLTPLGCRDLQLTCLCDVNGSGCQYQWLCIK